MIWVSRVLAAVTVIVGPALLVFGRSDLGRGRRGRRPSSCPFRSHFTPLRPSVMSCYGVTRADASALRATVAAIGCLLIPFVTFALSLPLLFALGESGSGNNLAAGIGFGVLALPTAAFQVLVTRRKIAVSILEFLSHPGTTGGAVLVSWFLSQPPGEPTAERIFAGWPILLVLTPFVALAVVGASAVPLRRLASACVLAAIPIYSV